MEREREQWEIDTEGLEERDDIDFITVLLATLPSVRPSNKFCQVFWMRGEPNLGSNGGGAGARGNRTGEVGARG